MLTGLVIWETKIKGPGGGWCQDHAWCWLALGSAAVLFFHLLITMFKKTTRAKNIRRKIDTSDDEHEPETGNAWIYTTMETLLLTVLSYSCQPNQD